MRDDQIAVSITALEHGSTERSIFADLDAEIRVGTVHAIVGPSGSGKSTLLRMIGGLERPRAGHIRVFGRDVSSLTRGALRRHLHEDVGFVFQEAGLVDGWTVEKNLRMAAAAAPRVPVASPLSIVEAVDRLDLPRTCLNRRALDLSGGERQRVALARVLLRMPRLLILDEPTAALDEQRAGRVAEMIIDLAGQGATVLLATHDPELLRLAESRTLLAEDAGSARA